MPSRVELLEALQRAGRALTVREAAAAVGLHANTARVHLEKLVRVGLAERRVEPRTTPGRPRTLYAIAPGTGAGAGEPRPTPPQPGLPQQRADVGPDEGYKTLAGLLARELSAVPDARAASVEAGRRWADASAARDWPGAPDAGTAVDAVVDHMHALGFHPEATPGHDAILLRRCPFEEVARENRGVVCGVHLGLLEGVFDRLGAPVRVAGLEPFAQEKPLLCVVRLAHGPGTTDDPEPPTVDRGTDRDETNHRPRSSR